MESDLSFDEEAVKLAFNPDQNHEVHKCKQEFAAIIDRMKYLQEITHSPEVKRMALIAITEAQTAQMWSVKAITWQMYAVKAITWKD
jgi:hypothetical protein